MWLLPRVLFDHPLDHARRGADLDVSFSRGWAAYLGVFGTFLKLDAAGSPEEKLSPFTKFGDKMLTELVCSRGMDVRYHRGKYISPKWIGAWELEKDGSCRKLKDIL
mmetsp:Transcript_167141/g.536836  ORF Transcript_167141/g.536836 Transcript_167141/m.536836 type:complete len:107 (-) Transcript_167141:153-473(-)